MTVHWTENALEDLAAIRATIARRSERYAHGMLSRIFDRAAVLVDHPLIGPMVPEFDDAAMREVFEPPYRIIYRVLPNQIDVLSVIHAARRMTRKLIDRP